MSKEIFYRQCILKRPVQDKEDTYIKLTSWIPEKYAIKGKYLKLKNNGVWENGWEVIYTSDIKKPEKYIVERERDYKTQRNMSDI